MRVKRVPISITLLGIIASTLMAQSRTTPPPTKVDNVTETVQGVTIPDPYRWLEDQNSPETRAWVEAQNQYTQSKLTAVPARGQIHRQVEKLLKVDTIGPPTERGGRYFFSARRAEQPQPVVYIRRGLNAKDEVLLDPNSMSPDQTVSIAPMAISEDGALYIYGVRRGGEDEVSVHFLDVDSKKDLSDSMPRARYSGVAIKPDKSGIYYSKFTEGLPGLYYHAMGADSGADAKIFGDGLTQADFISPEVSWDGQYLTIFVNHGSSGDNTKVYIKDLQKDGPITAIVDDIASRFQGEVEGNHLYMSTNWEAPNGRLIDVDLNNPSRKNWKVIIPESSSALETFSLVGGKIFATYLDNASTRTKVFDVSGKLTGEIEFPSIGTASPMFGRWGSDEGFYEFQSFAQPATIYRYQPSTGKQEVWARINVPMPSDQIEVKQVWYQSKDGTRVPMFLVYKKGIKLDGNNPAFLTGYGGFNVSLTPVFSAMAVLWAENGGVFAQPNLRGGGEFGEKWHRAGMLDKKQNVFDDFISAAEWLIGNKYTSPSRLAIGGGSNGGLLVGTAMTQRPELFQAVICTFPLLDMIRYQNFLVAKFWVPEYGSSDDPKQFQYILKYSPYQNVKRGTKYPAVMFVSGDFDTRVAPLHARKMAALMQASTGSDRPVLLHYDTKAGHSGGLPLSKNIDNLTDNLSFLFWQLGIQPPGA
jgi:prolyl oligopeptidase